MAQKTVAVAKIADVHAVRGWLVQHKSIWIKLLMDGVDAQRFLRVMMAEVTRNPALMECTKESVLVGFLLSAQLGLEPGREIHLVPFNNSKIGRKEAIPIINYQGKIKLMTRGGYTLKVEADVVYPEDEFFFQKGLNPDLVHKEKLDAPHDKAKIICAYAVATLVNGEKQFAVVSRKELDATKARAKSGNDGPWVTDFDKMCMKTAVHRLEKFIPKSTAASVAFELDNMLEAGNDAPKSLSQLVDLEPGEYTVLEQAAAMAEGSAPAPADGSKGKLQQHLTGKEAAPPAAEPPDTTPEPGPTESTESVENDPLARVRGKTEQELRSRAFGMPMLKEIAVAAGFMLAKDIKLADLIGLLINACQKPTEPGKELDLTPDIDPDPGFERNAEPPATDPATPPDRAPAVNDAAAKAMVMMKIRQAPNPPISPEVLQSILEDHNIKKMSDPLVTLDDLRQVLAEVSCIVAAWNPASPAAKPLDDIEGKAELPNGSPDLAKQRLIMDIMAVLQQIPRGGEFLDMRLSDFGAKTLAELAHSALEKILQEAKARIV